MKSLFVSLISFFLISLSEPLRIELQYDNGVKELQIHVEGKQIELVQIFANEKLLVEFDSQQIPPWDSTIRLKMTCPEPCRFYYVITTKQGGVHRIKSKRSDLSKNGTFVEIE
jgi:hypothetical protein